MAEVIVNGLVAVRDHQPYIQLLTSVHGIVAQLSMAEARNFAMDILQMCARTEADAMLWKFGQQEDFPEAAIAALMMGFRDFRAQLDDEVVGRTRSDPDTGEKK